MKGFIAGVKGSVAADAGGALQRRRAPAATDPFTPTMKPFTETEFNGIGVSSNLHRDCADMRTFRNGKRSMQETAAFFAVLGAAIALIAAYSLWALGRK